MPRRATLDAVVLRAVDVGEADRFCILLTREKGKIAARARAVRKPGSRMGGSLLPLRRVVADITESGDYALIVGASDSHADAGPHSFGSFLRSSQGVDMLLSLIEDSDPLPAVFDLLCAFLQRADDDQPGSLTAFQAKLLHLLGLLPAERSDPRVDAMSDAVRAFLRAATSPLPFSALAELVPGHPELSVFLDGIIDEHANRPLKSRSVVFSH